MSEETAFSKILLPFITYLTKNEYTVIDSLHFAGEICKHIPDL